VLLSGGWTRVRPILMTAVATILALMPLAVVCSSGGLIAANLATVVISGLLTSTALTLVVVPVLYSLFNSLRGRMDGMLWRTKGKPLSAQELVLQRQIRHEPGTLRYDVTGGYHDDSRGDRELVRGT